MQDYLVVIGPRKVKGKVCLYKDTQHKSASLVVARPITVTVEAEVDTYINGSVITAKANYSQLGSIHLWL